GAGGADIFADAQYQFWAVKSHVTLTVNVSGRFEDNYYFNFWDDPNQYSCQDRGRGGPQAFKLHSQWSDEPGYTLSFHVKAAGKRTPLWNAATFDKLHAGD